jgi:hypothetical protein
MLARYESELNQDFFKKHIEGKKVIVVGSGPSAANVKWNNLDFDTILTVSFFYNKLDLLDPSKIKFALLSRLVNLSDSKLVNFLDSTDCAVGFEVNPVPFYKTQAFKDFVNKYRHKYVNFWTKDHSNALHIGTAGRCAFFAQNFNPSVLYYVGIDGVSKDYSKDPLNSFRKTVSSPIIKGGQGHRNYDLVFKGHQDFARIAHERAKSTGGLIYNLGEGKDYNMSTAYSEKHFPLTKELKEKLQ